VELEEDKWETEWELVEFEWDRTGELELAAEELTMELETGLRREDEDKLLVEKVLLEKEEDDRGEEEKLRRNKEYV